MDCLTLLLLPSRRLDARSVWKTTGEGEGCLICGQFVTEINTDNRGLTPLDKYRLAIGDSIVAYDRWKHKSYRR